MSRYNGRVQRGILKLLRPAPMTTSEIAARLRHDPERILESLVRLERRGGVHRLGSFPTGRAGTQPILWQWGSRRVPPPAPLDSPQRVSDVLQALHRARRALTLVELVTASGWSATSVRRSLHLLERRRLARQICASHLPNGENVPALWLAL